MIPPGGSSRLNSAPAASTSGRKLLPVHCRKNPGLRDQVADPVSAQGVDPAHPEAFRDVEVGLCKEVMPLGGRALVIADQKRDALFSFAHIDLVPCQPRNAVWLDDDLGREVDGVDLGDLRGMELLDHVLGHELSHVADAREPLDEDFSSTSLFLQPPDLYRVHPRAILLNLPLRSFRENLAGWDVRVGPPQQGHKRERV